MSINEETKLVSGLIYSEEEEEEFIKGKGEASLFSTVANLLNVTVGAGILLLPYAFKNAGLAGGLIMYFFVTTLTAYSLYMVTMTIDKCEKFTLEETAEAAFGKVFGFICKMMIVLLTVGMTIGYVVIIGECLTPLLKAIFITYWHGHVHWIFYNHYFITALICFVIVFPIACLKSFDALKYFCLAAIVSIVYLVILLGVNRIFLPNVSNPKDQIVWFNFSPQMILALPIFVFAQNCHHLVFPISEELNNRTVTRMNFASMTTILIYSTIYLIGGIIGYLTYFELTKDNILVNLGSDHFNIPIAIAQVGVAFSTIASFASQLFACRNSLNLIFVNVLKQFETEKHYFWAFIIISVSYTVASIVPDVGIIFGLVGSLTGSLLMYVIPSMMYIKLVIFEERKLTPYKILSSILPFFVLIVGVLFMIFCTAAVIFKEQFTRI
eukprot:gene8732-680_t